MKFYADLENKGANLVKAGGWVEGADRVSAVGWDQLDRLRECTLGQKQSDSATLHSKCPLAATSCFTRHGPFAVGDSVSKTWDLSLIRIQL